MAMEVQSIAACLEIHWYFKAYAIQCICKGLKVESPLPSSNKIRLYEIKMSSSKKATSGFQSKYNFWKLPSKTSSDLNEFQKVFLLPSQSQNIGLYQFYFKVKVQKGYSQRDYFQQFFFDFISLITLIESVSG